MAHFRFGSDGAREFEVAFVEMNHHTTTAEKLWSNCTKQNYIGLLSLGDSVAFGA